MEYNYLVCMYWHSECSHDTRVLNILQCCNCNPLHEWGCKNVNLIAGTLCRLQAQLSLLSQLSLVIHILKEVPKRGTDSPRQAFIAMGQIRHSLMDTHGALWVRQFLRLCNSIYMHTTGYQKLMHPLGTRKSLTRPPLPIVDWSISVLVHNSQACPATSWYPTGNNGNVIFNHFKFLQTVDFTSNA